MVWPRKAMRGLGLLYPSKGAEMSESIRHGLEVGSGWYFHLGWRPSAGDATG